MMRFAALLSASALAAGVVAWPEDTTGKLGDAPVIRDSPPGVYAIATMPAGGSKDIIAEISVSTSTTGQGVNIVMNVNGGIARTGGPFLYHVHELPVPEDGNCTSTKAHLDPYQRGEDPVCDPQRPASCQTGDLSGKHGNCAALPGCSMNFTDGYLSLNPSSPSYLGNRSIVLHYANKTRIACANFIIGAKSKGSNSTSSASGGVSTITSTLGATATGPRPTATSAAASPAAAPASASLGNAGFMAMLSALVYALL